MQYDEFVGQVQSRAKLGTTGDAVRPIRATPETLAEWLSGGATPARDRCIFTAGAPARGFFGRALFAR